MTEPFLQDPDVTLLHGDVFDRLRELPDESVDCVITSPPYWGLRDYGTGTWEDGNQDCDHTPPKREHGVYKNGQGQAYKSSNTNWDSPHKSYGQVCGKCGARRVDNQLGLEPTPDLYVARMVEVFREVRRVLAKHGTCWVNMGDSYVSQGGDGRAGFNGQVRVDQLNKDQRVRPQDGLKSKDLVGMPWRLAFALQQPYYTGRIKDERDRIWLAATIEAEGCLFIHRRKAGTPAYSKFTKKDGTEVTYTRTQDTFGVGLEVASTDRIVVERCLQITGLGSINEQTPEQNQRRKQTIYRWNLRTNECRDVIRELYPHLLAKKHEARLLLGCPSSGDDARKAWESLKALHQGQSADIDFREPEGMWEEGWFLRSDIIWAKCRPNPMPESVTDRPTKAHEYVFLLSKRPKYWFDQEAVRERYQDPREGGDGFRWHSERYTNQTPAQSNHTPTGRGPDGRHVTRVVGADGSLQHRDGERWPNPTGRNIRSVWEIATQPYPEAHFATYPEELVRRCLLAGCPEWVCRECGKPRERIVDVGYDNPGNRTTNGPRSVLARDDPRHGTINSRGSRLEKRTETLGWSDCGHGNYRPGRALDPFVGSGTTCLVARNHGRHAIGIDLRADYLELAARRLQQLSLLAETR